MTEHISDIVKEVRRQLDLSQEDLARKLGVSFATINRWENAKTSPSRLALSQFYSFCKEMEKNRKLDLTGFKINANSEGSE